jgi:hypothetical protein
LPPITTNASVVVNLAPPRPPKSAKKTNGHPLDGHNFGDQLFVNGETSLGEEMSNKLKKEDSFNNSIQTDDEICEDDMFDASNYDGTAELYKRFRDKEELSSTAAVVEPRRPPKKPPRGHLAETGKLTNAIGNAELKTVKVG